jgi:tol-pal system protein YbgF
MNSQELNELRSEVVRLNVDNREIRDKSNRLSEDLKNLIISVEGLRDKVFSLSQSLNDYSVVLENRLKDGDGVGVLPSSLYSSAYGDYSMGKFDLAYSGFEEFVNKYPGAELGAQAQYYMGECFYSQKQWGKAIVEYEKVVQNYKKSSICPSAMLKLALSYESSGDKNKSLSIFTEIVKELPQTPEAAIAKENIKLYDGNRDVREK